MIRLTSSPLPPFCWLNQRYRRARRRRAGAAGSRPVSGSATSPRFRYRSGESFADRRRSGAQALPAELHGRVPNLQFNITLAFQSRGVGTLVCIQKGDAVYQNDPVGFGQCIVRDVQYQTPAMDRADAEERARRKAR